MIRKASSAPVSKRKIPSNFRIMNTNIPRSFRSDVFQKRKIDTASNPRNLMIIKMKNFAILACQNAVCGKILWIFLGISLMLLLNAIPHQDIQVPIESKSMMNPQPENQNDNQFIPKENTYIPVIPDKARCGQTRESGVFSKTCLFDEIQGWLLWSGCSEPRQLFLGNKISWVEKDQMLALELAFEQRVEISYLVIELSLEQISKYIKSNSRAVLFAQTKQNISEDSKSLNRLVDESISENWEQRQTRNGILKDGGSNRPKLVFPCISAHCSSGYDRFRIEIQNNEVLTHELSGMSFYETLNLK